MSFPTRSHRYLLHAPPPGRLLPQTHAGDVGVDLWRVGRAVFSSGDVEEGAQRSQSRSLRCTHHLRRPEPLETKQRLSGVGRSGRCRMGSGAFEGPVPRTQATVGAPHFLGPHGVLLRLFGQSRRRQRPDGREDCCYSWRRRHDFRRSVQILLVTVTQRLQNITRVRNSPKHNTQP